MLADSFTQTVFDMLSEAGEFEDPLVCYHRARGLEVSGYGVDEDEGRLDLFLSIHTNTVPARKPSPGNRWTWPSGDFAHFWSGA